MSSLSPAPRDATPLPTPQPRRVIALLAFGAGLSAASLYYNQPMLETLARELHASSTEIGLVPMTTQLGYATGIVAFAPLGDLRERRQVIVVKAMVLAAALVLAGLAPSVSWLVVSSFVLGLAATVAQDAVPAAASIALPESRGRTVGTVMTGLLSGILLSRVVSGTITAYASWRVVFFGAAAASIAFGLGARKVLPLFPATVKAPYGSLLASMLTLLRDVAPLRRAALAQGLLSVSFGGFWATLTLALAAPPFALGSVAAGSFGIAGAAGALIAPVAGSIADRRGPASVAWLGAAVSAAAFAAMAGFDRSLFALVLGTIVFDLGTQASLIAHQTIVYAQDPGARSRLNAVLVSSMFLGMAAGAFLASRLLARYGFRGVCSGCAVAAVLALLVRSARGAGAMRATAHGA